ncbi:reverse transcriptase domain-containing protein [Tanacetum coccineum]
MRANSYLPTSSHNTLLFRRHDKDKLTNPSRITLLILKIMPPRKAPITKTTPATTTNTTSVTNAQLQEMIDQGVTFASFMAARDCNRMPTPYFSKALKELSELTQWFERMETNSHVRTIGHDVAYSMTWTDLKKKITDKYCPRSKIKKLEVELWNLKVKGTNVLGYTQRFQELALLCVRMFPEESDKIEKYVGGLPDMIHGSVMASRPKTMQDAIEMATELMDKKISTLAERQAENKRKLDNNQAQQ